MENDQQKSQIEELQQEVEALRNELTKSQQKAALGELLSTTTHEFNNILMTIINYAKLGMRHKDEAGRNKSFEKILSAGQRAAKISHGVLGMAKNRSNGIHACELKPMLNETLFLLERELTKYRINLETDFQEVPDALANPNQIQQVVINLLVNARQAMRNGGTVQMTLTEDVKNKTVDLKIRDDGPGIQSGKLQKIFDPYFSTKSGPDETGKGGTGLGLYSCRQIIEAHHGRIRVASTVGVGTEFTIKLPIAKKAPIAPAKTSQIQTEKQST